MAVAYHQGGFPPPDLHWPDLLPLIGPANAAVARYEGVLHGIPNPNVLLSPLTSQGADCVLRITCAPQSCLWVEIPAIVTDKLSCSAQVIDKIAVSI